MANLIFQNEFEEELWRFVYGAAVNKTEPTTGISSTWSGSSMWYQASAIADNAVEQYRARQAPIQPQPKAKHGKRKG